MRTAAEYRAEAEHYVRESNKDISPSRRVRLLEMAQSCLRMADQADLLESEGRMNGYAHPLYSGL